MNGILIGLIGYFLILGEALFAWKDSFLTVEQMRNRGLANGIPLLAHGGILGDAIILTPMLSWLVYKYSDQWKVNGVIDMAVVSAVITIAMCFIWVKFGLITPEALTHDGILTVAGLFHGLYMTGALAIILLTFFYTQLTFVPAVIISLVLGMHLIIGNHIPLSFLKFRWYAGQNYRDIPTWLQIAVLWGLMAWRCIKIM